MPYNFEATFVRPLIADLDSGRIGNAKDWANLVTDRYINTIKMGAPVGVAQVLPAPGLNPGGPPPPFTIGSSGYTTANLRRQQMYSVLVAYASAKELNLQKLSINSIVQTVDQVSRRLKRVRKQIKNTKERYRQTMQSLEQLPDLFEDLQDGANTLLKKSTDKVDGLLASIRQGSFGASMSQEQFQSLFAVELSLLDSLKTFKLTDRQAAAKLSLFVLSDVDPTLDRQASAMKARVRSRLKNVALEALRYVEIPFSPSRYVDLANDLDRKGNQLKRFTDAIRRIDFIERYIRPQLAGLLNKIRDLVRGVRKKLSDKLKALREKLKQKKRDYASKKRSGKKAGLFKNANKALKKLRKENANVLKSTRVRVRAFRKLLKTSNLLLAKSVALSTRIEQEIADLKNKLTRSRSTVYDLELEKTQVSDYLNQHGLTKLVRLVTTIITNTGATKAQFVRVFELRLRRYKALSLEIDQLFEDLTTLQLDINALFTGKRPTQNPSKPSSKRLDSIFDLLALLYKFVRSKLRKIANWLGKQIGQLKRLVIRKAKKYAKGLEEFALHVVPLGSDSKDFKTKQEVLNAKREVVRKTKRDIAAIYRKLQALQQAVPSATALTRNLEKGKYKLSDNDRHINNLSKGLFRFRREGADTATQTRLHKEESKFRADLTSMQGIETVLFLMGSIGKSLSEGQGKVLADQAFDSLKRKADPDRLRSIKAIQQAISSPPKTARDVKHLSENLTASVFSDYAIANTLINLERRVISKASNGIKSILDSKGLTERHHKAAETGDTTSLSYSVYEGLDGIARSLDKHKSIILMLLQLLIKLIRMFTKWLNKIVNQAINAVRTKLLAKLAKLVKGASREGKTRAKRQVNLDAFLLSVTLGIATRLFWTGASWQGPSGSSHSVVSIGSFTPNVKARSSDGRSALVRQMARGLETQLVLMQGFVTPPAVTGIPPLPFVGYR